mgnify:FL=1
MSDPDLWKSAKEGGREIADAKIKELGELNDFIKRFGEIEKLLAEEKTGAAEKKLRRLE